jgi:predicted DNA-binding protein (MmcQ/YjbR family)
LSVVVRCESRAAARRRRDLASDADHAFATGGATIGCANATELHVLSGAGRGDRGLPVRTRALGVQGGLEDVRAEHADWTPLEVSVKCEPEIAVDLGGSYAAIRPGYHLNKRRWNTITLDGSLPDRLVRDLIEDSYDLVVSALPKRIRAQLGWAPESEPAPPAEGVRAAGKTTGARRAGSTRR